ncbi:MAG TPA: MdtA/MuxA family multidrug efflux RND transporter periplasmic adaptor subunit [Rhodopila sp.]|uniref:MdtA/MuxA family multidrug efflux RND transporter periplasmic adaptor subunit n=1 Tax=Rhodopila sp. TaxID=2480087 RepID=UPI002C322566|nr:MdtA/MuxA family multidrug efflux RND transporter periplasmic adaptor subunit [Rhodopila sp.]HVY14619.1 MdtA/MuxA family multidrug efflux RND transporter periplasmic adaptor subunit [Rhodopila sp.]
MDEIVERERTKPNTPATKPGSPTKRRSGLGRALLALVVLGAIGGGWYWWAHREPSTAGRAGNANRFAQGAPQPVGFATIDKGDIRIILNELGTVTSLDTVTVYTQISGQLQEIGFKEGQEVHKGDFLAQIDPRPYQAALEQAEGTLAKDQGLLAQAQTDLKRYQTLGRQDSIAQQQLDDQKYLVQQYAGQVKADQGAVDTAKVNLSYCRIVSPIDGLVGLRQVDEGNYIQASGTTGIAVITQLHPISVLFSVTEDNLPDILSEVRKGQVLDAEAYDRTNTRHLESGHLATLDNVIDTTTGTLKLRALFDNPDEMLIPNQFVNVRLLVNTLKDTVRVPVSAVQRGEPGTFVYVVNANDTVSVRTIKVGPIDGQYEAVTSGLQPGDRVVTEGTDRLRDGSKVTLPQAEQGTKQGAATERTGVHPEQTKGAKAGSAAGK